MTVFHSNCSLPPEGTNFVSSPNARGTLDILWSCLSILVLGTWSILHFNVPIQSTPENWKQKCLRTTSRFWGKLKWMAFNILAPELALGKAWSDYCSVSILEADFDTLSKADKVSGSRTHTYFANMCGITIRFTKQTCQAEEEPKRNVSDHAYNDASSSSQETNELCALPVTQNHPSTVDEDDLSREITVFSSDPGVRVSPISPYPIPVISSEPKSSSERPRLGANASGAFSGEVIILQNDDEENDELFADYMHARFQMVKQGGFASAESLEQSLRDLSRSVGVIDWIPDNKNADACEEALLSLGFPKHFKTDWQRCRFLRYFIDCFHNLHALRGDLWILDAQ